MNDIKQFADEIFGYRGVSGREFTNRELERWEREDRYFEDMETYYREVEKPNVMKSIKDWMEEYSPEERFAARREYLLDEIEKTRRAFFRACEDRARCDDEFAEWSDKYAEGLEKRLHKLHMEVHILIGKKVGITPETIARARQHPITNFVKPIRGMASCPFHRDRHPSMDIRKNFYFCYSCGASGDVINFVMRHYNIGFKEAINRLSI